MTSTLSAGTVRISVQAKGAGMISPNFATLLVFVQTDARMDADEADLLLTVCVKRSFDRITVDGQLSTSDMIIMLCSGESGVEIEPESDDERAFGEALDAALRQVSLLVARDGEGARRVGRVLVRGGDPHGVERVAHAVADSPLVKTALYGADPNWGRVVQAVGRRCPTRRRSRSTSRSRGFASAATAATYPMTTTRWSGPSPAMRSSTRSLCRVPVPRANATSPTSATST